MGKQKDTAIECIDLKSLDSNAAINLNSDGYSGAVAGIDRHARHRRKVSEQQENEAHTKQAYMVKMQQSPH